MSVDRITMGMDPELGAAVRDAAKQAGMSLSAWLSEAAADKLRNQLLGAALDAWQEEDGPFTPEELAEAAATLGLEAPPSGHRPSRRRSEGRRSQGSAA